jgi:hypothetical protein
MPQMIIANRLSDGLVVFLAAGEGWVEKIDSGLVIDDSVEAERLLAVAKRHETRNVVVEPALIDVEQRDGRLRPVAIREAIRAFGPTVRTDLTDSH